MAGFLETYGAADAKRARTIRRWAAGSLAAAAVALGAYWYLHDFREKRQVAQFLNLLEQNRFEEAYRLWGCSPAQPCRDYNTERFMEDWGPKGAHAGVKARVRRTRSCESGVIQIVEFAPGDETLLYVDRATRNISFSPFSYCVDASGRNTNLIDIFFR